MRVAVREPQQDIRLLAALAQSHLVLCDRGLVASGSQQAIAPGKMIAFVAPACDGRGGHNAHDDKSVWRSQLPPSSPAAEVRGMLRKARALG